MIGWVYFIACEPMGAVKIGFTRQAPQSRLSALQTGCPSPLKLLAVVPATIEEERKLHESFAPLHIQGEWFRNELKLKDMIFWIRGDDEIVMASRDRFLISLHDVLMQSGGWYPYGPVSQDDYDDSGTWEPFHSVLWDAFGPWAD